MRIGTKLITDFIINNVELHPMDIAGFTARHFGITPQAVLLHIKKMVSDGVLITAGQTRARRYRLKDTRYVYKYKIADGLSEDRVWVQDISKHFAKFSANVWHIWDYAFSEIFNNAIEHSRGTEIKVVISQNAISTSMLILDNGIGIFKNIQNKFGLLNEHEAILELSKGKLTTDKKNHSGQGIFFTSRAVDRFVIESHGILFVHDTRMGKKPDILFDSMDGAPNHNGTAVFMRLNNTSKNILLKVFDDYTVDDYGFDKTVIPIELAQYGDDFLVSRSQARRVLSRVQLFKHVIFDFKNVPQIGQAFADEIFRVFANAHPNIKIQYVNANKEVESMILRAKTSNIGEI
ncbi:MAG: DUF4325 domain-containing protein [Alphaproteobacteria bacterium]|nr:DUF4325 domain-containing protein [Alphaproteobacteria bacterium]